MAKTAPERAKKQYQSFQKLWGAQRRFLTAFSQSCLLSSLTQGHIIALCLSCLDYWLPKPWEQSRALGLHLYTGQSLVSCSLMSPFFCTELEDDSDTSLRNILQNLTDFLNAQYKNLPLNVIEM